jgi:hypothetical protein
LEINGKEAVRFNLPEPRQWTSSDKSVELRFDIRRTIGPDTFGLFHLTVPKDRITVGEPARISVRSIGKGSRRWFSVIPYTDVTR